jgi:hypothetical protein
MPTEPEPRPTLRDWTREWLGITALHHHLRGMEHTMATITDALTRLAQQVNDVSAAQASSFHNLQAAIDTLKSGELSTEQQDAVDQIEKSLIKMGEDARTADDGYEPAGPPADEPTGGDVPGDLPTPADNSTDQPVDDTGR